MPVIEHNPGEGQIRPGDQLSTYEPESRGLLGTAVGVIAGLALFGVGLKAVKGLGVRASLAAGSRLLKSRWLTDKFSDLKRLASEQGDKIADTLVSKAGTAQGAGTRALESFAGEGFFNSSLLTMKDTRLGTIFGKTPIGRKLSQSIGSITKPFTKAAKQFGADGGFRLGLSTIAKRKDLRKVAIGKSIKWAADFVKIAPAFYATEQMFFPGSQGYTLNPVEHAKRFGKFVPHFAMMHAAFGGVHTGFSLGLSTLNKDIAPKVGDMIAGSSFARKIIENLGASRDPNKLTFVDKMFTNLKTLQRTVRDTNAGRTPLIRGGKGPDQLTFFNRVQQNLETWQKNWKQNMARAKSESLSKTSDFSVLTSSIHQARKEGGLITASGQLHSRASSSPLEQQLQQLMEKMRSRRGPNRYSPDQTFISKALGLKRATTTHGGVEYMTGRGLYTLNGQRLDLRRYLPKNILESGVRAGTKILRFPGITPIVGGQSPLNWFGAKDWLSARNASPITILGAGSVVMHGAKHMAPSPALKRQIARYGRQTPGDITASQSLVDKTSKTLLKEMQLSSGSHMAQSVDMVDEAIRYAEHGGWLIPKGEAGILAGGKLFRKPGSPADAAYELMPGMTFRETTWNTGKSLQKQFLGLDQPALKPSSQLFDSEAGIRKMIHDKIAVPLEWGAGHGQEPWALGKLFHGWAGKYFRQDSPYHIYGKQATGTLSKKLSKRLLGTETQIKGSLEKSIDVVGIDHANTVFRTTNKMLAEQYNTGLMGIFKNPKWQQELSAKTKHLGNIEHGGLASIESMLADNSQLVKEIQRLSSKEPHILQSLLRSEPKAKGIIKHLRTQGALESESLLRSKQTQTFLIEEHARRFKDVGITNIEELQKLIFKDRIRRVAENQQAFQELNAFTKKLINRGEVTSSQAEVANTIFRGAQIETQLERSAAGTAVQDYFGGSTSQLKRNQWRILQDNLNILRDISGSQTKLGTFMSGPQMTQATGMSPHMYRSLIPDTKTLFQKQGIVRSLFPRLGVKNLETGKLEKISSIKAALGQSPESVQTMDMMSGPGLLAFNTLERLNRLAEGTFGAGMNPATSRNLQQVITKWGLKRALPLYAGYQGIQAIDAATDESIFLDNTGLEEGTNAFASSMFVKARLAAARAYDVTGITSASQYFESVMPGFISSPLSAMARTIAPPAIGAALLGPVGALGGGILSAAQGFGLADMTKSEAQLREIYSGREEVAVRKGRFWEFGTTPYWGGRIQYHRPNWFAQMRAAPEYTDTLYGSKGEYWKHHPTLQSFTDDPYYWEKKHYYTRPYPVAGSPFEDVPVVGPTLSSTVGQLFKPAVPMHEEELDRMKATQWASMGGTAIPNEPGKAGPFASSFKLPDETPITQLGGPNFGETDSFGQIGQTARSPHSFQAT